jgi:hypothetical protein
MTPNSDNGSPRKFGSLREKIAAEKAERAARYQGFADLHDRAHAAGHAAAIGHNPRPMIVRSCDIQINGRNVVDVPGQIVAVESEGACGFAWVKVRPANCSFARWAAKERGWSTSYGGGLELWISAYGQSVERKTAYAEAFARVLCEAGINAYAGSRLD